jgi:coenzyme F420-0:L-glutamate ligase / coenzyme F420-1:gamma-L-glutamate ligase
MNGLRVIPVVGIPEVTAGADIGAIVADAARAQETPVEAGDVVVIAQKIVSKAEGRQVPAATREEAREVARRETRRVLRETPQRFIVETHHGLVCANAGVDSSNVEDGFVLLLPRDPDASAQRIRATLESLCGGSVAVIVSDTFGRTWRNGHANVAIGSAGIEPLVDYRGQIDPSGHELVVTEIAHIDELASAAELVQGKLDRVPVAIVRGYEWYASERGAGDLIRPVADDLFR